MLGVRLPKMLTVRLAVSFLTGAATLVGALDRVELADGEKLHGRIVSESAESVKVKVGKTDTVVSLADIEILTYSEEDFKTEFKLTSSGSDAVVTRGKNALESGELDELRPGDMFDAGSEGELGLLFKSGMQLAVAPGASALITVARTEKKPYASYMEARVERGEAYCMVQKGHVGHGKVAVHTPNATVRVREALFMMRFDSAGHETSVAVRGGAVGVRLRGSDIGEVIVNGGERVVVSSVKNKVMQDELSRDEAGILLLKESLFAFRRVGDVEAPRVRKGRPLVARWYFWTPIVLAGGGGVAALLLMSQEKVEWPEEGQGETTIQIEGTYQ